MRETDANPSPYMYVCIARYPIIFYWNHPECQSFVKGFLKTSVCPYRILNSFLFFFNPISAYSNKGIVYKVEVIVEKKIQVFVVKIISCHHHLTTPAAPFYIPLPTHVASRNPPAFLV